MRTISSDPLFLFRRNPVLAPVGYILTGAYLACLISLPLNEAEASPCPCILEKPSLSFPSGHPRFVSTPVALKSQPSLNIRQRLALKSVRKGQQKAEKAVSAYVTMYGYADNHPPNSATIAHPVIHQKAGGTGTFKDPITFATDPRDIPIGTKIYVPYLQKYFINEDICAEAIQSRTDRLQVDLWVGDTAETHPNTVRSVQHSNTRHTAQIILNPRAGYPVNTTPFVRGAASNQDAPGAYD